MDFTEYIPPCSLAHSVNLNVARGGVRTNGAFDSYKCLTSDMHFFEETCGGSQKEERCAVQEASLKFSCRW